MSVDESVHAQRHGTTLLLTLSNPGKKNAFFPEMRRRLTTLVADALPTDGLRGILIAGADGHFCAGADVTLIGGTTPQDVIRVRETMKDVHGLLRAITGSPLPVYAAVEGDAFGAGFSLAAACDYVIAGRTARFGAAFSKIGLLPDMGVLWTLTQRVGAAEAKRLMMLSPSLLAPEVAALGLVDLVVEPGTAVEQGVARLADFSKVAPLTTAMVKASFARGLAHLDDAMQAELDYMPLLVQSEDHREGLTALREKRPAIFKAR